MGKGTAAGLIIAMIAGSALGYGLIYIFPTPGTILQTQFSSFRSIAVINDETTSVTQVADTQLNIITRGGSYLIVRFSSAWVIHLFNAHYGVTLYQVNLTMNSETKSIQYIATRPDGAVADSAAEDGGSIVIAFVSEELPAGTYTFRITWRSVYTGGSINSQLIFCSPTFNSTRSFFIQEIHI